MEIKLVIDAVRRVYTTPCNLEGEPEFAFQVKEQFWPYVTFRYEIRDKGRLKIISWKNKKEISNV